MLGIKRFENNFTSKILVKHFQLYLVSTLKYVYINLILSCHHRAMKSHPCVFHLVIFCHDVSFILHFGLKASTRLSQNFFLLGARKQNKLPLHLLTRIHPTQVALGSQYLEFSLFFEVEQRTKALLGLKTSCMYLGKQSITWTT